MKDTVTSFELAEMYAEFCVMCDRNGMPLVKYKDWIENCLNEDGRQD